MKTRKDPRHQIRRKAVQALFTFSFGQTQPKNKLAEEVKNSLKKINKVIKESAPQWPIEKINKIDLAILRLAVYELVITKKEPPKVIIDEAVELAKEFGSEKSPGFVNGALGNILKKNPKSEILNPKQIISEA